MSQDYYNANALILIIIFSFFVLITSLTGLLVKKLDKIYNWRIIEKLEAFLIQLEGDKLE